MQNCQALYQVLYHKWHDSHCDYHEHSTRQVAAGRFARPMVKTNAGERAAMQVSARVEHTPLEHQTAEDPFATNNKGIFK